MAGRRELPLGRFGLVALALVGCAGSTPPTFNVLSIQNRAPRPAASGAARRDMVAYVEVVNPARRPISLQRLQYTFASSAARTRVSEVHLGARQVAAGSAVIVEVPLAFESAPPPGQTLTLIGRLWTEQDRMIRSFQVAAEGEAPAPTAANPSVD